MSGRYLCVVVVAGLAAICPRPALAAIITVDTANGGMVTNDGDCSFREAMDNIFNQNQGSLECASAAPSGDLDTVVFTGVTTITLDASGSIFIAGTSSEVLIQGPITIDGGNHASPIFRIETADRDVTLDQVTLRNADASAILLADNSTLTATLSTFQDNQSGSGAAINAAGTSTVTLALCSFEGNDATGDGGAIWKGISSRLFVAGGSFFSNSADRGGAIYIAGAPIGNSVLLDGVTFQMNSSDGTDSADGGGAIYIQDADAGAIISIVAGLFGGPMLGNTAERRGGAIYNQSDDGLINTDLTDFLSGGIIGCDFTGNTANGPSGADGLGGAIYNQGNLHVLNSTFDDNSSTNSSGGAIGDNQMVSRSLVISNSTFNGNDAADSGGALAMLNGNGNVEIYNSTLSGNTAGVGREIYAAASADVDLYNTLIANTSAGANCSATGAFVDNGGNLLYDSGNNASCGLTAGSDPLLQALTFNAGPLLLVRTMELGGGSPALGIGVPATCSGWPVLSLDGRGILRPSACDSGAFEGGAGSPARLVINELDVDQGATDDHEFIEIFNSGGEAVNLGNVRLDLVDGDAGGAAGYASIALPTVDLAAGGYYVVCGQTGNGVPLVNCDLDASPDTDLLQDGAPDAVGLRLAGVLLDAVSYGGDTGAPYTEGDGAASDPPAEPMASLSRIFDGFDSGDNSADFSVLCATPKLANGSSSPAGPPGCLMVPVELLHFAVD